LAVHLESKTRGFVTSVSQSAAYQAAAARVITQHRQLFRDDPYYNPNLSLNVPYELAFPPRVAKPWRRSAGKPRIFLLMLDDNQSLLMPQVHSLADRGCPIFVGSRNGTIELPPGPDTRVILSGAREAAEFAISQEIDYIIIEDFKFLSSVRWLGGVVKSMAVDVDRPGRSEAGEAKFWLSWVDLVVPVSEERSKALDTLSQSVNEFCLH